MFMNRIAGDYWDHPRLLMQQWMDRINCDVSYNDLLQRLRSGDDEQFRSAYLELYLHESLLRAGYEIVIHPEVPGTTRQPDFLAIRGDDRLHVEAIAPGSTAVAKAAASRRAVLFDTVNRLQDPNFILWLDHLVDGPRPPRRHACEQNCANGCVGSTLTHHGRPTLCRGMTGRRMAGRPGSR